MEFLQLFLNYNLKTQCYCGQISERDIIVQFFYTSVLTYSRLCRSQWIEELQTSHFVSWKHIMCQPDKSKVGIAQDMQLVEGNGVAKWAEYNLKACSTLEEPNRWRRDSRWAEYASARSSCLCSWGIRTSASNAHLWQWYPTDSLLIVKY